MRIRKRIELGDILVSRSEIASVDAGTDGEPSAGLYPDCGLEFALRGTDLDGYGPTYAAVVTDEKGDTHPYMGGYPETTVGFEVEESDLPRVKGWFEGSQPGAASPESEKLKRNRTSAVRLALERYFGAVAAAGLFAAPFRIAWRYRLKGGSYSVMRDGNVMWTYMQAPLLPVRNARIDGNYLATTTELRSIPAKLFYRFNPNSLSNGLSADISGIEVFITKPVEMYYPDCSVAGVTTHIIDDKRRRCWNYTRYSAGEVRLRAMQDTDFRLISTFMPEEIQVSEEFISLDLPAGALTDFSKLPKPAKGDSSIGTDMAMRCIKVTTEPLHLGYPEEHKSLHGVTLRGVFDRNEVRLRVYASDHREHRRLVAAASGPYVRGLCCARWRWFEVEIKCKMREGDFFEALTFDFSKNK